MHPGTPRFTADRVRRIAEAALGRPVRDVARIPAGWANDNWRVDAGGDWFVVKIGPQGSAPKWAATGVAYAHAARIGVPAPRLVHLDTAGELAGGQVVRILSWVAGHHPAAVLDRPERIERFFAHLGATVRDLHDDPQDGFSSRLDGSAPRFDDWEAYVRHRVPQIVERARGCSAFSDHELDAFGDEALDLASTVSDGVRPSLCHRDLHLGNVRAGGDGSVVALLDFDGVELWDRAVDMVKLRWLVFPVYEGSRAAFDRGYFAADEPPGRWEMRVRLASLLELVNAVANARAQRDDGFEQRARQRLDALSRDVA